MEKIKKTRRIILYILVLIGSVIVSASPILAQEYEHHGITDCFVCHDFENGHYDHGGSGNLRWVKSSIEWPEGTLHSPVKFVEFSSSLPADGMLADGDDGKLDGPCEVCHPARMKHHTSIGDGTTHHDAQNCTGCHTHFPAEGHMFSPINLKPK